MTSKSYKPIPKVMNGGIAGAIVAVLIWFLGESGYSVTPEMASLITLLVSSIAAYMTPPVKPDPPVEMWATGQGEGQPADWGPFKEENQKDA